VPEIAEVPSPERSHPPADWGFAQEAAFSFSGDPVVLDLTEIAGATTPPSGSIVEPEDDGSDAERRNALVAQDQTGPDLSLDNAFAGPRLIQLAQATPVAAAQQQIGRIEKVSGNATIIRNGVQIELQVGNPVYRSDIVQTGSGGSVAVKFTDGTVFMLSPDTRVAVNEMVYSATSTSNSVLFNIVQGTMALFAGKSAKTGDFAITTPVATMGIRGTAVLIEVLDGSKATKFSLLRQPNGTEGSFVVLDKAHPGHVLAAITDARTSALVSGFGATEVLTTFVTKTPEDLRSEGTLVRSLFQVVGQQGQRRGGGDFDGGSVIPALFILDTPDLATRTIVEPAKFENRGEAPPIIVPTLPHAELTFRASAAEDGPVVSVNGLKGIAKATVVPPTSLPAGVVFDERTSTFKLDPSAPTFQKLAQGEKLVVTVVYGIEVGTEMVPARVSWTVTGTNDAPVAHDDRLTGLKEKGPTILAVGSNDRDVDGDNLHITHLTQPREGSVHIDANGNLVFDPGNDFVALSKGETATVSFTYDISDSHGLTDTATVHATVQGSGTFKAPVIVATDSTILPDTGQTVAITLKAPSQTTSSTANLEVSVAFGDLHQPMNLFYVIDISGSVDQPFVGAPVGDLNHDGRSNTILDAEIANFIGLSDRIRSLGFSPSDVTVTVVPFNGSADPADGGFAARTFNLGSAGDQGIADALTSLRAGGQTDPERALQVVIEKLHQLDPLGHEQNLVYVLSDGAEASAVTAVVEVSDSGFPDRMGVIGSAGGVTLDEQTGATATYQYASDDAAHNYFALVNSDAANQRVRYFAVLGDGTEVLIHDGPPAEFTFSDARSKLVELSAKSLILRFEDATDNDYNDFVARVSFEQLPSTPPSTQDERAELESLGAKISAVGMGGDADITALNAIDNTLGAEIVTSADGLNVSLAGLPFKSAEIDHIVLTVNSKALTFGEQDLVLGDDAFTLKVGATDLERLVGETNDVSIEVTLNTGIALTARLAIEGALPRSTDFVI